MAKKYVGIHQALFIYLFIIGIVREVQMTQLLIKNKNRRYA